MLEWLQRALDKGQTDLATKVAKKVLGMGISEAIARSVVSQVINHEANKKHRVRLLMMGHTLSRSPYSLQAIRNHSEFTELPDDLKIIPFMWGVSRLMVSGETYSFQMQPQELVRHGATIIVWGGVFKGVYVGNNECNVMQNEGSQVALTTMTTNIGTCITCRVEAE